MQPEIAAASNALEGFATMMDGYWTDQQFQHAISQWNIIPFSRQDMSERARHLGQRLKNLTFEEVSPELLRRIKFLPDQISWFQTQTLPHLSGGNLPQVVTNYGIILANIEAMLPHSALAEWDHIENAHLIPKKLSTQYRSIDTALGKYAPKTKELKEKIDAINEAHAAALDLPTDLEMLREARNDINELKISASNNEFSSQESADKIHELLMRLKLREDEAAGIIKNIHSAYSAATTVGLAKSFTDRASDLSKSTWVWVAFLIVSLGVGGWIGSDRLQSLQSVASNPASSAHTLWFNTTMSLLSIAGPIWFAWLATRQIGQRFRLAEDYAFKASVARAYEGYRREAARLDPALEARLFASALDRLEEAPLRFVSNEEHGSPYESLFASAGFQKALDKFPSLRGVLHDLAERNPASGRTASVASDSAHH